MHDIEPYFRWREEYTAEEDAKSPFYKRTYSEFQYSNKVYNYFIHPQWDNIGSLTLYVKILFVHYDKSYAIIELIGEWNDSLYNDIMFLKREVIDYLIREGISKFILLGEHVLNFHASDNCYYEEWAEEVREEGGWVAFVNFRPHVIEEMANEQIQFYVHFDEPLNNINWRKLKPDLLQESVNHLISNPTIHKMDGI